MQYCGLSFDVALKVLGLYKETRDKRDASVFLGPVYKRGYLSGFPNVADPAFPLRQLLI